jgi:glucose/arabinose dehydrogenase
MKAFLRSISVRMCAAALLSFIVCAVGAPAARAVDITLTPFASGFDSPLDIVNAGDSRLFVVEQGGHIRVVQSDGTVLGPDFLDIDALTNGGGEQGLLGMAFHPDYLSNGFFYVDYTDTSGDTQIVRYTVMGDPTTSNVANAGSAFPILTIAQPFANHNAGDLKFGPDGFLYIPMGDGGSGCDP